MLFLHWPFNTLGPQIHKSFLHIQEIKKDYLLKKAAHEKGSICVRYLLVVSLRHYYRLF